MLNCAGDSHESAEFNKRSVRSTRASRTRRAVSGRRADEGGLSWSGYRSYARYVSTLCDSPSDHHRQNQLGGLMDVSGDR